MSVKKVSKTTQRIIAMIESGNYDIAVIEHMINSLIVSRDREIKRLKLKNKPREFIITLKTVTGALRNCIKSHGPITKEFISSAGKRIYGDCQRVINNKT